MPCLTCGDAGGNPHTRGHRPPPTEFPTEGPHAFSADVTGLASCEGAAGANVEGRVRYTFKSARFLPGTITYVLTGFRNEAGSITRISFTCTSSASLSTTTQRHGGTEGVTFSHSISLALPGPQYGLVMLEAVGGALPSTITTTAPVLFRVLFHMKLLKATSIECRFEPDPKPGATITASSGGVNFGLTTGENTVNVGGNRVQVIVKIGAADRKGARKYLIDILNLGGGAIPADFTVSWNASYRLSLVPRPAGSVFPEADSERVEVFQDYEITDEETGRVESPGLVSAAPNGRLFGTVNYSLTLVDDNVPTNKASDQMKEKGHSILQAPSRSRANLTTTP